MKIKFQLLASAAFVNAFRALASLPPKEAPDTLACCYTVKKLAELAETRSIMVRTKLLALGAKSGQDIMEESGLSGLQPDQLYLANVKKAARDEFERFVTEMDAQEADIPLTRLIPITKEQIMTLAQGGHLPYLLNFVQVPPDCLGDAPKDAPPK